MPEELKISNKAKNKYTLHSQITDSKKVMGSAYNPSVIHGNDLEVSKIFIRTEEELQSLGIEELISYLQAKEPKFPNWLESSPAGLELALARMVENNIQEFAQAADRFQNLHPKYLLNFLRGLHQGINNQQQTYSKEMAEFPWQNILTLCQELTNKYHQILKYQINKDWQEIIPEIISLITVGLTVEELEISLDLRTEVWKIIKSLTAIPDCISPKNNYQGHSNHRPHELFDTMRGEAMHLVIRYALWVRCKLEQTSNRVANIQGGLSEIPEVLEILDTYLHPEQEPSLAIRSVYGQWFPWLTVLDPQWTAKNVDKIFPQEQKYHQIRTATWESYVAFSRVNDQAFDLLTQEYQYAIRQLRKEQIEKTKISQAEQGLSQHLMSLYWRGKLDLEQSEGLLNQFLNLAPDSLRCYALEVIGRSLKNTQEPIEPTILERLKLLWEKRLATARSSKNISLYSAELSAFGWWFGCGKFDQSWAMLQLTQVLELVNYVNPDFLVVEQLAEFAEMMPQSTVECLKLMIENDPKSWSIFSWHDETKTILTQALKSNNQQAIKVAKELIESLGDRGHEEFSHLSAYESNQSLISWMSE